MTRVLNMVWNWFDTLAQPTSGPRHERKKTAPRQLVTGITPALLASSCSGQRTAHGNFRHGEAATLINAPAERELSRHPATEICYYVTLIELRAALAGLEATRELARDTVVLVLDGHFAGHLPSLIRREKPGFRLILTSPAGRLPGVHTIGDLDAAKGGLGWLQIVFERDPDLACVTAQDTCQGDERLFVFWPAFGSAAPYRE